MVDTFHKRWSELIEKCDSDQYTLVQKIDFAREGKKFLNKNFHPSEVEDKYLPLFDDLLDDLRYKSQDKKSIRIPLSIKPKDTIKSKMLSDIWQLDCHGKNTYDSFIEKLKADNAMIGGPFLIESPDGLYWNESVKGHRQYLAAFLYQITIKKWIATWYSAPEYVSILSNTFLFKKHPNPEPFKSLNAEPPKDEYQEPFINWPTNI
jgi:hypothetical protein